MYSYIRGKLSYVSTDYIVVENNGIGYQLFVPFNNESPLLTEGEEIMLYTYLHVYENGITLFGFTCADEKDMFLKLINVNGIGPKNAISILSTLSYKELVFAILNDDDKAISKTPGVGPKTSKLIILNLKDKLDIKDAKLELFSEDIVGDFDEGVASIQDAIAALNALGYPYNDCVRAVKGIKNASTMSVEELLSIALKEI